MQSSENQAPPRRQSEPQHTSRHYHHVHPQYAEPEMRPRRHTDGGALKKVHSRPEDYKNRPRPDKMFEYICFDGEGQPQECSQVKQDDKVDEATQTPLDRWESYSSNNSSMTTGSYDADDDESEDELTLPATYHHDIAQKDHDSWPSRYKPSKSRHQSSSPSRIEGQDVDPAAQHHRRHREQDTASRRTSVQHDHHQHSDSSPLYPTSQPRRGSRTGSEHDDNLLAQVIDHLKSHKDTYSHGKMNGSDIMSELLGEVVRKVSDGGLEGGLMKEIVREVQHVL